MSRAADTLRRDPGLQAQLRALAADLDRPFIDVEAEAATALAEMAAARTRPALRLWGAVERLAARAYHLDVEVGPLHGLTGSARRGSLVFLPSHRSYLDPLVLREALRRNGFPANYVLGGINVAFWPVGPLARRAGYVFIRRSTRDDPVYRTVLRWYIGHLTSAGANLEWYVEGGRTRTGRLRPLRLGLLSYLAAAHREGRAPAGQIVPVSIVYDLLYEVEAMGAEERGKAKQAESLSWAWRFFRGQARRMGSVHVRFGQPIPLDEALGPDAGDKPVERLAMRVAHGIDQATPLTATALACVAFPESGRPVALTAPEVAAALAPFLAYLQARRLPITGPVDLASDEGLVTTLRSLAAEGALKESRTAGTPAWSVARPFEVAFYRNAVAPHFLNRALAELVAAWGVEARPPGVDAVWEEALRLRELLKHEFVFGRRSSMSEDLAEEAALIDPAWAERAAEPLVVWEKLLASGLCVAPLLLGPSVAAYHQVAAALAEMGAKPVEEEAAFLAACRRAASPKAAADAPSDSFPAAFRAATRRSLLRPPDDTLAADRAAFLADVAAVAQRLDHLACSGPVPT